VSGEVLRMTGVTKRIGETTLLDGVDLAVAPGEVIVIVGPSGAGKSTLLRTANMLERPDSGSVWFEGRELTDVRCDLNAVRQRMGIVFQSYNLFPHLTAVGNVALPLRMVGGRDRASARERAAEELTRVGLAHRADMHPSRLSGGEQQRVAIARALALEPVMMLFDEVTAALDPELVHEVLQVIRELARSGMTMVAVTHEIAFGVEIADRMLVMDRGRIIEEGEPHQLVKEPRSERARQFFSHVLDRSEAPVPAAGRI
jgi:polar amino acid transport system ATP-binding protein